MTLENSGLSRRKLLRTTAIGVPAAGLLAFGSTLVTATSAEATCALVDTDGWWGSKTSRGLQNFLNVTQGARLSVDGVISSQPSSLQASCPGLAGGWEWVDDAQASGSQTIVAMQTWLGVGADGIFGSETISALQAHYGLTADGALDGPSPTIEALQKEINQYLGRTNVLDAVKSFANNKRVSSCS